MAVLFLACGGEGGDPGGLEVVRDTVGDTVVVRTLSGSEWGGDGDLVPEVEIGVLEGDDVYMLGQVSALAVGADGTIYVMDRQIPALRVYGPDGRHIGTWGREGGGPGEFSGPDGGLTVLTDGRVAVRDPGNARVQLYHPDGTPAGTWPVIPGGFSSSSAMYRSQDGGLLSPFVTNLGESIFDWRTGLLRVDSTGTVRDTLDVPDSGYERATVEATMEGGTSINTVPFSPGEHWTWHPEGYFVHGVSDRYSILLDRPGEPLRIERETTPVPVASGERNEARAATSRSMRMTDPGWRWNGPEIPDVKPEFRSLFAGVDGRVWVLRHAPGVEGEDPDYDPSDPDAVEDRWSEPTVFDVFRPDGTFLGTVHAPPEMSPYPAPVFRGDQVWAVTRDDLGVQRVVRYRVTLR